MILLIAAVIGLVCPALPGLPAHAGSAPTSPSTTTVEIRYPLPAAGEVMLVWGVNGWRQIPEDMRPPRTVIHQKVMATPMARKDDSFVLTVTVESGAMIDYGFLVKQTARGTRIEVWDGDYAYGPATTKPDIVTVTSTNLYQNPLVLMDRTGMLFVLGLGVMVTALLGIALWSLWSQYRSGAAREPS